MRGYRTEFVEAAKAGKLKLPVRIANHAQTSLITGGVTRRSWQKTAALSSSKTDALPKKRQHRRALRAARRPEDVRDGFNHVSRPARRFRHIDALMNRTHCRHEKDEPADLLLPGFPAREQQRGRGVESYRRTKSERRAPAPRAVVARSWSLALRGRCRRHAD